MLTGKHEQYIRESNALPVFVCDAAVSNPTGPFGAHIWYIPRTDLNDKAVRS